MINRETAVAIIAGVGWLFFVVSLWVNGGLARQIMKQKQRIADLEKPSPKPKRLHPSRVEVQLVNGKMEALMGWKLAYPNDGLLLVVDDEDLVGAVFGAGKWISAVVREERKTPTAKPEDPK